MQDAMIKPNMNQTFQGKKVLIFGLGLNDGGVGMAEFFAKEGAVVTITDGKSWDELETSIKKLSKFPNIVYHLGENIEDDFINNDIIIQNPAVRPDNKFIKIAEAHRKDIEMEMSLFHKLAPCPIIGITGTKGKSTTTTLIYEILRTMYKDKVMLGGNIGKSAIRELPGLKRDNIAVLELSSFQLYTMGKSKTSPHVAVITNIYPDHLNWHTDMQDYINGKKQILTHQTGNDFAVMNIDDPRVKQLLDEVNGNLITYSLNDPNADYYLDENLIVYEHTQPLLSLSKSKLEGKHNLYNILAAIAVSRIYKIESKQMLNVLKKFGGVEGRQQFIREVNNVKFYNDTTATGIESMQAMFDRFGPKYRKRIILIAGGMDKGLDYSQIKTSIKQYCKALVLLDGTASEKINTALKPAGIHVEKYFDNFADAVDKAYELAENGDIVVLSPAAASFNMFKNEFDRGEQFNQLVETLN